MVTTAILIGTMAVLIVAQLGVNSLFLLLGSRWAKIPNVTFRRALVATVAVTAATFVGKFVAIILEWVSGDAAWQAILVLTIEIVICLGLIWLAIAFVFKTSVGRAALAWLPTLVPALAFLLLTRFVVKPYWLEAFKTPTNAMAPAILGQHWEAPCPRCGSPAYMTPEPDRGMPSNKPVLMMCSQERRSCEVVDPPHKEFLGDRLLVSKFIRPQRWDVIVFRYPEEPEINYCSRLVGLPGETVVIRDGAVWIDGEKQTLPDSCKGLEYLASIEGMSWIPALWGSDEKPARLGPDEYFVLGDFSARAKDSRLWQQGAPDHPPYAVPGSYILGVVTHIYWPPSRCACLR